MAEALRADPKALGIGTSRPAYLLAVPTKFSMEEIEGLRPIQKAFRHIGELHGPLPFRNSALDAGLPEFVKAAHGLEMKVRATIVMSPEVSGSAKLATLQIRRQIDRARRAGISAFAVEHPSLLEMVRLWVGDADLGAQGLAVATSILELSRLRQAGATTVELSQDLNRDFAALEKFSDTRNGTRLQLVANDGCMLGCPLRSVRADLALEGRLEAADCVDTCAIWRARDPVEYLRATWIRPEDVGYYTWRFGIPSFRIASRGLPDSHLLRIVAAYAGQEFEGDLIELLAAPNAWRGGQGGSAVVAQLHDRNRIRLDNGKLGGFVAALFRRGGCTPTHVCSKCRLCNRYVQRASVAASRT